MSEMSVVLGLLGLNVVLVGVGFSVMAGLLESASLRIWLSYLPLALLVGAALCGVLLEFLVLIGFHANLLTFGGLAICLCGVGLVLKQRLPAAMKRAAALPGLPRPRSAGLVEQGIATACCCALVVGCVLVILGGVRTAPWLDDSWTFWIPKGLVLGDLGLDPHMFTPSTHYLPLTHRSYPLMWSLMTDLAIRFVGNVDLRAVTGELAIITVAFVGSVARLLTGFVRPALLWLSLTLLILSPEIAHQTQGGGADLVLGTYLALFVICAFGWIRLRHPAALVLVAVFGGAALATKVEAAPEFAICGVVLMGLAWRLRRESLRALMLAVAAAVLSWVPWFAWAELRAGREPTADYGSSLTLSLSHGIHAVGRVGPTLNALIGQMSPAHWLLIVPTTLLLMILVAVKERRVEWLAPVVILGLMFLFLVSIYWLDSQPLRAGLASTVYRVFVPLTLIALVGLPVAADRALAALPRWDLAVAGIGSAAIAAIVVAVAAPVSESASTAIRGSAPIARSAIQGVPIRRWTFPTTTPHGWIRDGGARALGAELDGETVTLGKRNAAGGGRSVESACLDAQTGVSPFGYQFVSPAYDLLPGRYLVLVSGRVMSGGLELGVLDTARDRWVTTVNYTAQSTGNRPSVMGAPIQITRPLKSAVVLANMQPAGGSSRWTLCAVTIRKL